MNSDKTPIGKCSQCGGIVSKSFYSYSLKRQIGICETCGAHEDEVANLPVIKTRGPFNTKGAETGRFLSEKIEG